MKQTKFESHVESTANIASGFVISYLVWVFIVGPLVSSGVFEPRSAHDAFLITCIFTVTSYIRSYFWRRFFNAELHRAVHNFARYYIRRYGTVSVSTIWRDLVIRAKARITR